MEVFAVINKNFLLSLPPPTTLDAVLAWPAQSSLSLLFCRDRSLRSKHFLMKIPRPAVPSTRHPRLKINLVGGRERDIFQRNLLQENLAVFC